jgi:hypothetical protein
MLKSRLPTATPLAQRVYPPNLRFSEDTEAAYRRLCVTREDAPSGAPVAARNSTSPTRAWAEFAVRGYALICARKHGLAAPLDDLGSLSDEELERRLSVVRDLAHLPPA